LWWVEFFHASDDLIHKSVALARGKSFHVTPERPPVLTHTATAIVLIASLQHIYDGSAQGAFEFVIHRANTTLFFWPRKVILAFSERLDYSQQRCYEVCTY
jgi:hypothetical protein